MTDWKSNAMMWWSVDGTTWNKISDHNRSPLDVSFERIERKNRMVGGTLRRYSVAKKRTLSCSWENFPAKRNSTREGRTALTTVDGGWAGEDIETFYNTTDGRFWVKLRKGIDDGKATSDGTIETIQVMFTDFSKSVVKRGDVDLWSLDVSLEEV